MPPFLKEQCLYSNRRRHILIILLAVFSITTLASYFLPFIIIKIDSMHAQMSAFSILFSSVNLGSGQVLGATLINKVLLILSMLCLSAGFVFVYIGRYTSAAFGVIFSSLLSVIFSVSSKSLLVYQSNIEMRIDTQTHWGWIVFFVSSVALALTMLLFSGTEKAAESIFRFAAFVSVGAVVIITVYMFVSGVPAILEIGLGSFIFGTQWRPTAAEPQFGILYMILASLLGCIGAIIIGVPIGLLTAVFTAEVAPEKISRIIRPAVELLAGIPSVIYGFWGMKVLVPAIRELGQNWGINTTGSGLAAVIVVLSIMILPTIIKVAETSLQSVPRSYMEAALALGNTKVSTIFSVQIPAARSGILAGVILGVGRAIGETMAVIMVAGNIVQLPSLFGSVRPMTAGIAFEMGYADAGLHRQALFAIGLVLFVFIMLVNVSFSYLSKKGNNSSAK